MLKSTCRTFQRKTVERDHDGDEPFGLGEYAETVGPQGLLFIIKGKTPVWRKLMWMIIIFVGIFYSGLTFN